MGATAPAKVVIAGGGIAGVEALMALHDLGEHALDIEIVAARDVFVLRPQIIGVPWGGSPLRMPLSQLTAAFGARFVRGTVEGVDAASRELLLSDGSARRYDQLLLATGAVASVAYPTIDNVGFGGVPGSLARRGGDDLAIVVPPGSAWTLPAHQLALLARPGGPVTVVTPEHVPGEVFGPAAAVEVAALLARHDVTVRTACTVPIGSEEVRELGDRVVALPLLRGPGIAGLPTTTAGFVPVGEGQRVRGMEDVLVAGDAGDHHIKQGGLAAHQAEVAATTIVRALGGDPPPMSEGPVLRGKLVAGEDTLYLRRALDDDADAGTASARALWQPEAAMCAWRLTRWLVQHGNDLHADALGPLAHPPTPA